MMKYPPGIVNFSFRNRGRLTQDEKRDLWISQSGQCHYCGLPLRRSGSHPTDGNRALDWATIDHVIPFSKGGKTKKENCVYACRSCNSRKGAR